LNGLILINETCKMRNIKLILVSALAFLSILPIKVFAQIKPEMILVDGGTFQMGNPKTDPQRKDDDDEAPVHMVKLNSFYIGKYEVSVKEYKSYVEDNSGSKKNASNSSIMGVFKSQVQQYLSTYKDKTDEDKDNYVSKNKINAILNDSVKMPPPPDEKFWEDHPDTKIFYNMLIRWWEWQDNYPMHCVTWYEAVAYCNWLSEKEGLEKCYSVNKDKGIDCDITKNGYRLPTEAEWEFAARGGTKSQNFIFSGSNSAAEVAWYDETTKEKAPQAMGSKKANELGIFDMSGNVWEWCSDYYFKTFYDDCKKQGTISNPMAITSNSYRVLRGGGWYYRAEYATVTSRDGPEPYYTNYTYGFRLARTIK